MARVRYVFYNKDWISDDNLFLVKFIHVFKGWCDEFETAVNIIIAIVQKVYKLSSCPLAKMISLGVHHFGKRTVWSLLYFLNYGYYDI